ncbi:DNA-directed RNA polymerase II subunit RPB1-like protein [Perilla frutescens var. hirtella]|nr:DNA-directed RNA polymerase II subunit RPB1-like protein [Perilla frutescens var. hirtella]
MQSPDSQKGTGPKKFLPPVTPTQSVDLSSSEVSYTETFQPTTPGNSPGVGHYSVGQKHNTEVNGKRFTTLTGKTDGFQPTTPGHSPGVGHSIGN